MAKRNRAVGEEVRPSDEEDQNLENRLVYPLNIKSKKDINRTVISKLLENLHTQPKPATENLHYVPYADIIVAGFESQDSSLELDLKEDLYSQFGQWVESFHVAVVKADELKESYARCYLGPGVFCKSTDDIQVCDVEFSLTDPDQQESLNKPCAPILVGDWLGEAGDHSPAGWYEGQRNLAVAFTPLYASAYLSLDQMGADTSIRGFLKNIILYIGSFNRLYPPILQACSVTLSKITNKTQDIQTVELPDDDKPGETAKFQVKYKKVVVTDPSGSKNIVQPATNGQWQRFILGDDDANIWLRITDKVGEFPFRPNLIKRDHTSTKTHHSQLVVCGFLLPSLPSFYRSFGEKTYRRRPKKWMVDFNSSGHLRYSEIMERGYTMVGQWGKRYAMYRYGQTPKWSDESSSENQNVSLKLSKGKHIELHQGVPWEEHIKDDPEGLDFMETEFPYHTNILSCGPLKHSVLGSIPIVKGRDISIQNEPVLNKEQYSQNLYMSLDWLNRAALVETIKTQGLANYWMNDLTISIHATQEECWVTLVHQDLEIPIRYKIKNNKLGIIGPLCIKYFAE